MKEFVTEALCQSSIQPFYAPVAAWVLLCEKLNHHCIISLHPSTTCCLCLSRPTLSSTPPKSSPSLCFPCFPLLPSTHFGLLSTRPGHPKPSRLGGDAWEWNAPGSLATLSLTLNSFSALCHYIMTSSYSSQLYISILIFLQCMFIYHGFLMRIITLRYLDSIFKCVIILFTRISLQVGSLRSLS